MVLEDGGLQATLGLKVRDPSMLQQCIFGDPIAWLPPSLNCSLQGKVYIVTCDNCLEEVAMEDNQSSTNPTKPGGETRLNYVGMTGTSLHARSLSHLKDIRAKDQSNSLAKHIRLVHGDIPTTFTMRPMSSHRTVLSRYKTEAVYIEKQLVGSSLNNKTEGSRGGLV